MKYNGGDKGSKKPAPKTQPKSTMQTTFSMAKKVFGSSIVNKKK